MAVTSSANRKSNDFFAALTSRATEIENRHLELSPASADLFSKAGKLYPGGYTRDAVKRNPHPLFIERGDGSVLIDSDGRRIDDFWLNATSLAIGHANPRVVEAVREQMTFGSSFFAPSRPELDLAEMLISRLPSAERVRFTNSGSEAVMVALRIARAYTKRTMVVKFEGSYHGIYDDVYWSISPPADRMGPTENPTPVPHSAGLPFNSERVLVLPFNNPSAVRRAFEEHGDEIATLIVEPMANRVGLILPHDDFLDAIRQCCDTSGAVLIFDEVIAFRLGYHGAQGKLGVTPDVTTLGKLIGGGFPVGGIAGRADILSVTETGSGSHVTHSGTFNANPVTMRAGRATLDALTPEIFDVLNAKGAEIRRRLREICDGLPLRITGAGSLFKVNATEVDIVDYRGTVTCNHEWERLASLTLLNEGFFLTPSLQGCLATSTTDEQVDRLLAAIETLVMG